MDIRNLVAKHVGKLVELRNERKGINYDDFTPETEQKMKVLAEKEEQILQDIIIDGAALLQRMVDLQEVQARAFDRIATVMERNG